MPSEKPAGKSTGQPRMTAIDHIRAEMMQLSAELQTCVRDMNQLLKPFAEDGLVPPPPEEITRLNHQSIDLRARLDTLTSVWARLHRDEST